MSDRRLCLPRQTRKTCPGPDLYVLIAFHHTPGTTLNALSATPAEEPADRIARHLATCREIAELGMDMLRTAHAARETWRADHPAPDPVPPPAQTPAPATHTPRTRAPSDAPRHETANPGLVFARIAHAIERIITLEARIAAHQADLAAAAARLAANRAYRQAAEVARTQPSEPPPQYRALRPVPQPCSADTPETPSLLATIGKELGIDLQNPTRPERTTDPP